MKYLSVCSGIEAATVAWAKKLKARHDSGENNEADLSDTERSNRKAGVK